MRPAESTSKLTHSPAHCVVPGERPRAVGAGYPDALVALPDVRAQVRLVAVRPLAERAPQLRACGLVKCNEWCCQTVRFLLQI